MPQSSETVLGKHDDMFDPQDIDPEVSVGTDDKIPPEFPDSSEEEADHDRVVELMQRCIAFINDMQATRPEILRGVRVWKLLRYLPSLWLRGKRNDLHGLSQQATQFDQFWSHSWQGSGWTKYTNILYLHNCMPASIAGTLSASIACGLVSAGFLDVQQRWCLLSGFVAFCTTLLLWHPQKLVFLDIACINQADQDQKGQALLSMGAFLKQSKSMLVLWDPTWASRLWCIFEIAAFLHSRSSGCKADLQIVPPLLGPALLGCEMLFCIACIIYNYIESSMSEDGILVGELYLLVSSAHVLLFVSFVTHALRGYGRNIDTLQEQLRGFKVEHARSACCDGVHRSSSARLTCDRKVIHTCIAAWYSSLDSFELQVQTDVRLAITDQLAYQAISYQRIVLLSTPYVWLRLHYASSHAGDPTRQAVDMAQTFTYLLAIFPLVDKLGVRLCYRWRARCCRLYLDFLLSLAVVIVGLSFYIVCYAIQLYVFRQNDRGLLLSVISMLSWWTVAAILWRFI